MTTASLFLSSVLSLGATPDVDFFAMDGAAIIQDENDLAIANGMTTAGINYHDAAVVSGFWAPPYASHNFTLDARVDGRKIRTTKWLWRPFQVVREGSVGQVKVVATTTLIHGTRAGVLTVQADNAGKAAVPIDVLTLAWLSKVGQWGFGRTGGGSQTVPAVRDGALVMEGGGAAIVVTAAGPKVDWQASGNVGTGRLMAAPGKTTVHFIFAMDTPADADKACRQVAADPDKAVAAAVAEHVRQVGRVREQLPMLESDNKELENLYRRSLVHFVMNRWEVPEFALQPYYSTGSIKGGCLCNYLWNFGEVWEILPLYEPAAAASHTEQFLKIDLMKHFFFEPLAGKGDGLWYMVNQEKVIGLAYYYVMNTGDTAFLQRPVDGRPIIQHIYEHAMYGDKPEGPATLIDYGDSNSHLELRRGYPYNHVMPDLNGRRYLNYLRAAELCEVAGQPRPVLRERAKLLKPLLTEKLWDRKAGWFAFANAKGEKDLRYTVQMFKMLGSGVLTSAQEKAVVGHLNEREFLSDYGLHSMSKQDVSFDQLDIDNGGGGNCTCFPPHVIERLYAGGHDAAAADILGRILWWGQDMPYWGDSIAANCRDYRKDTPLQCTLDGVSVAQSVIFGVFGVAAKPDGSILVDPHRLPFAPQMALRGLKLRGHTVDIAVNGAGYTVTDGGKATQGTIGKAIILPAIK